MMLAGAFFVVVVALLIKAGRRRLRLRLQIDQHVVARFDDVDAVVARARCACGRRPDQDGEGPRDRGTPAETWGVELSCVCGRRRSLRFVVGN